MSSSLVRPRALLLSLLCALPLAGLVQRGGREEQLAADLPVLGRQLATGGGRDAGLLEDWASIKGYGNAFALDAQRCPHAPQLSASLLS